VPFTPASDRFGFLTKGRHKMRRRISTGGIYLDNQATTPLDPRVWQAMKPLLLKDFGNPHSSSHIFGRLSAAEVDNARLIISECIGAFPEDVIFTSGATESNNLAILGFGMGSSAKKLQFITSVTEHKSVLEPMLYLKKQGLDVKILTVDTHGRIDINELNDLVKKKRSFVSISAANSEIGVLNPVKRIGALCQESEAIFHCDATQAIGKIDFDLIADNVNLLSLSAHKIYGPKGIGALIVQSHYKKYLCPMILGGGQQYGLRSGTVPTFLVAGLAKAMDICKSESALENKKLKRLSDYLLEKMSGIVKFSINGCTLKRLPNNLNLKFEKLAIDVLSQLPMLAMSTGSACLSSGGSIEPSYVLRAIGLSDQEIRNSIRISVGRFTTEKEINIAAEHLIKVLAS
jgi:cysteine desulfurase